MVSIRRAQCPSCYRVFATERTSCLNRRNARIAVLGETPSGLERNKKKSVDNLIERRRKKELKKKIDEITPKPCPKKTEILFGPAKHGVYGVNE